MTKQENFADKLYNRITKVNSILCAGIDPRIEHLPKERTSRIQQLNSLTHTVKEIIDYYKTAISLIERYVAAIKINIAFFEKWGPLGIEAFDELASFSKLLGVPVIGDCKRSDIGSTAKAYAESYLEPIAPDTEYCHFAFDLDAITVNPFLGFDTLEPFVSSCKEFGKGIFILVRTSNSGALDIQGELTGKNANDCEGVSVKIANWIADNANALVGSCGISSLGAVVGATHPEDARILREIMSNSLFLIPGFGHQGASAKDATSSISANRPDGIVNVSRALFSFSEDKGSTDNEKELKKRAEAFRNELNKACGL